MELTNNHSVNRQEFLVWFIEITQVLLEQEAHDDNENDDLEGKHNSGAGGVKGTLVAFECISCFVTTDLHSSWLLHKPWSAQVLRPVLYVFTMDVRIRVYNGC